MKRTQKLVVLSRLLSDIRKQGSWGGETHLQKAVYLLEELEGVPLEYPFVLYKHGPFSFDLRDELNLMRADGLMDLVPRPYPYGPSYMRTQAAGELEERFPKTLGALEKKIAFVANTVRDRSAADLEKLGTALFLIKESPASEDLPLAEGLHAAKPHVSVESALEAIHEMRGIMMSSQTA